MASMNDATRIWIEEQKAKRKAMDDAKEEQRQAKEAEREIKRKATEDRKQKVKEQRLQRMLEQKCQSNTASPQDSVSSSHRKRRVSLTADQLAAIGSGISGSSLVRDFCYECGEAIRVVNAGRPNVCLDCRPTGNPGARDDAVVKNAIEYHGGRFHSAEW